MKRPLYMTSEADANTYFIFYDCFYCPYTCVFKQGRLSDRDRFMFGTLCYILVDVLATQ